MASPASSTIPVDSLLYIFTHVFLPIDLPQRNDFDANHERVLLDEVYSALQYFQVHAPITNNDALSHAASMIQRVKITQDDLGFLTQSGVLESFAQLRDKGGAVSLHIREQNAGILVLKDDTKHYRFEAFELAPKNESVYSTKGRLRRSFPTCTALLSAEAFENRGFQIAIAQTLSRMSSQAVSDMQTKVSKSGRMINEIRDTTDPAMVTENFMAILRSLGQMVAPEAIHKHTREEILWKNAELPFRRSPQWLLLRVSLQLLLDRQITPACTDVSIYKHFMIVFMSRVLQRTPKASVSSYVIHGMNAKLARRIIKLNLQGGTLSRHGVDEVMKKAQEAINLKWASIATKSQNTPDFEALKSTNPEKDAVLELPIHQYVWSLTSSVNPHLQRQFNPSKEYCKYAPDELPQTVGDCSKTDMIFNLAAFEAWVAEHLQEWIYTHLVNAFDPAPAKILSLIQSYHAAATSCYQNNPERQSVMFLSILELWIASDRLCCEINVLLRDYFPDIPVQLLQSLVLPWKGQMVRVCNAEQYLNQRKEKAKFGHSSIFVEFDFAKRFFDQSSDMQSLRETIERDAAIDRDDKRQELCKKQAEYQRLLDQHNRLQCTYNEVRGENDVDPTKKHSPNCEKCKLIAAAKAITIEVHEWPLPANDLYAKATVFELSIPLSFSSWRDNTAYVLLNVLGCEYACEEKPRAEFTPHGYQGLASYVRSPVCSLSRIGLLSEDKPVIGSHWRNKTIDIATEYDVCVPNGMRFRYFDTSRGCFVWQVTTTTKVSTECRYKVDPSILKFITKDAVLPNGPPPNEVIAGQSECPSHLALDEYKALCILPIGYRIFWLNILSEVSITSCDFTKPETTSVLLQTMLQCGPPEGANTRRASHKFLADESFADALLTKISEWLDRIKANWETAPALANYVAIAARLLSLTDSSRIQGDCLKFLAKARTVSFSWTTKLQDEAQMAHEESLRSELFCRTWDTAMVCIATFDVEDRFLRPILSSSWEASIFIQCCIKGQSYCNAADSVSDQFHDLKSKQWNLLCWRAMPILTEEIMRHRNQCLDDAVTHSWANFEPGSGWRRFSADSPQWIVCTTRDKTPVQYNVLTSELLVNGLPLTRLPSNYEQHSLYRLLFRGRTLEVSPSTYPNMEFTAKKKVEGHVLHFGIKDGQLLICALIGTKRSDVLPRTIFDGVLPDDFLENYIQWYDHDSTSVEFRPVDDPWVARPENFRLRKFSSGWKLAKDNVAIIGALSKTATAFNQIMAGLEAPQHIHLHLDENSDLIELKLPRLRLEFLTQPRSTRLASRQFPDFIIDHSQAIGTLHGFRSLLVLRNERNAYDDRIIIIPEAEIFCLKSTDHVTVSISQGKTRKYQVYQIDQKLGRLVDNGSLQSKLMLCYLHALTSFCLVDRLTQRTGTEQALEILSSAAIKSFESLTKDNVAALELIAKLSSSRLFYPRDKRVMVEIIWDGRIPKLSQHDEFRYSVMSVLNHYKRGGILRTKSEIDWPDLMRLSDDKLMRRNLIRTSTFRVDGYGAQNSSSSFDVNYISRSTALNSHSAMAATTVATLIVVGQNTLHQAPFYKLNDLLWDFSYEDGGFHPISGPIINDMDRLEYDSKWRFPSTLSRQWCAIHKALASPSCDLNKFNITIWLATLAYANIDMQVIQLLAALFNTSSVQRVSVPRAPSFNLAAGRVLTQKSLRSAVSHAIRGFRSCPEYHLPKLTNESAVSANARRHNAFQGNQNKALNDLCSHMLAQFPREVPDRPTDENFGRYIDMGKAMKAFTDIFKTTFANHQLYEYFTALHKELKQLTISEITVAHCPSPTTPYSSRPTLEPYISIKQFFRASPPSSSQIAPKNINEKLQLSHHGSVRSPRLDELVGELGAEATKPYEQNYVAELNASIEHLRAVATYPSIDSRGEDIEPILRSYRGECANHVSALAELLTSSLYGQPGSARFTAAAVGQHPRVSPSFLLGRLSPRVWSQPSAVWKQNLIDYALAITELQRAERLLAQVQDPAELAQELLNQGHSNWSPAEHPETLLLEVESGILIRPVQEEIAKQMRSPPDNLNAVMQLLMGQGKTFAITPIVAAALANGTCLTRIGVPKPLHKIMSQMLIQRLGGMLNHRIYYFPFSRDLQLTAADAVVLYDTLDECRANGGILLFQPEHPLSFQLMAVESILNDQPKLGEALLKIQHLFKTYARDIVDESDEIFSVKFELVYTIGSQIPLEASPDRWILIPEILALVARFASVVKEQTPGSIEYDDHRQGRYPKIRFLREDAARQVLQMLAQHICESGLPGLPIARQPEEMRAAIQRYISNVDLNVIEISVVQDESAGFWTDLTKTPLLLIRGLIACGVFDFTFNVSKRWRVNYGLDATRNPPTKLAVPFRGKDSPTPRSEFSHPDASIVFTSLSYYYGGLDDEDLFVAFKHLIQSDRAQEQYAEWVSWAPQLKLEFRHLIGINLKDRLQCVQEIFPALRFSKNAIDYFLSNLVFPKEMRTFEHKLSASGWDLASQKVNPTTGFSGTKDSCHVLPLSMRQLDLANSKHTDALVLDYLLQDENSVDLIPPRDDFEGSDAEHLLSRVVAMEPPVYVLLEVGAQILESSNKDVAQTWLAMVPNNPDIEGALYFDDSDQMCVVDRTGLTELFHTSSHARQPGKLRLLVFLDEQHTRGVDLKLPSHYRAVLTLGPKLTKDRLVQAAMRMRKLGHGQSIVFCIPSEIAAKIREKKSIRDEHNQIQVKDVIIWSIGETFSSLRESMPLWAVQGERYERQKNLWDAAETTDTYSLSKTSAEKFMELEAQSLEQRYGPKSSAESSISGAFDTSITNIRRIIDRCQEFDCMHFETATLQEEQERELAPEIEVETQVERPGKVKAEEHAIHTDVRNFVNTGILRRGTGFIPAFQSLKRSSAANSLDVGQFSTELLITLDFHRTVNLNGVSDFYERPVHFVLTGVKDSADTQMVIISPHEAQELLPFIQQCRHVTLSLYHPRPNKRFQPLDDLTLFTVGAPFDPSKIPRRLTIQLNLFAGQLYMRSFQEYTEVCDFLGLSCKATQEGQLVRADGFIIPEEGAPGFKNSPVEFFKVLVTRIRRNCQSVGRSHLGKILSGELLDESDFE